MTMSHEPSDDSGNEKHLNRGNLNHNNDYSDDGSDLDDFIASSDDDDHPPYPAQKQLPSHSNGSREVNSDSESEPEDRITKLNKQLKANEDYSLKLLRAHISNLASSIGGPDHTSALQPPPYKLGPDALDCLKDFKHWIRSVDVRKGTFDVALAISEVGLVNNDLIVILCQWDQKLKNKASSQQFGNTMLHKISLVCLELLVQLTWPFEKTEQSTPNQVNHYNNLRKAQLIYKKQILSYNNGQTFKSLLRLALPAVSQSSTDRDPKDAQILKLVLLFMRNILYLKPVDLLTVKKSATSKADNFSNLPATVNEEDISLSSVINCFQKNKVLMFLQTIVSGLGKDFDRETYGPILLESIYLLTRGVPATDLLSLPTNRTSNLQSQKLNPQQQKQQQQQQPIPSSASVAGLQLQDLLKEESRREKISNEHISTRHGRFGSLLSVRNDDSSYVVSGQDALLNNHRTFAKLDNTKKWRTRSRFNYDANKYVVNQPVHLTAHSCLILNQFIQMFLVSGNFNTLIKSTASVLANSFYSMSASNMLDNVDSADRAHYFATVAWFFEYKRQRNDKLILAKVTPFEDEDPLTYGSVGAGLSDVNFVLICQYMRESYGSRDWNSLHVALICLRELLLIAYSIFTDNPSEEQEQQENDDEIEDRELAEGIIRKLFGEADYVNLLYQIPRSAYDHSPEYLRVVVQVVHILLKSFEKFANQDIKLYMKSKRRQKKRRKAAATADGVESSAAPEPMHDGSDEDSERESRQVISERQLDFRKNEAQFFHKGTVTTHIVYLSRFEDLSPDEIKKALSFFHKLFVVRKDYTGLYRLDFMYTLYRVRNHLPRSSSVRQSVDEFIHYFMKKFKQAFARFPLPIELLFPRFEDIESKSFLATGNIYGDNLDYKDVGNLDDEESSVNTTNRLTPGFIEEWVPEPKRAKDVMFAQHLEREQEIEVLVACLHQNEKDWVIEWLIDDLKRISENRLSDGAIDVLLPSPVIRRLLITDPHLRLLVEKFDFMLPSEQNDATILSRQVGRPELNTNIKMLEFVFDRVRNGERDPEVFQKLTKKKKVADKEVKNKTKPRKRRHKRLSSDSEGELELDEEDTATKISKRYDPSAALKSHAMVSLSDDESDDEKESEFYKREEQLRHLLQKSGGITDAQQLESFKKAWAQYELMGLSDSAAAPSVELARVEPISRPISPSKSPAKPVKPVLRPDLVVADSNSDDGSDSAEDDTAESSPAEDIVVLPWYEQVKMRRRSYKNAVRSDVEVDLSVSEHEDESASEDEDAGNDTTINKYVSAKEASSDDEPNKHDEENTTRKRKRLIITDDEDEE